MKNLLNHRITRWAAPRFLIVASFLVVLNWVYSITLFPTDVKRYSRVLNRIDSAFEQGDIIYLGESSNTSFNPWTDTLQESISDFLKLYLPEERIEAITHEGYHPGLFKEMLNRMPYNAEDKIILLGVNMRTCGPSAIHSANEASNQREALFYSKRPPLLTRGFMGLHFYDNKDAKERERRKFQWWRTRSLKIKRLIGNDANFPYETALDWINSLSRIYDLNDSADKIKGMAGAYVKEFAFVLDDENPRLKDLKEMVDECKQKGVRLIFHLLPPNRYHAEMIFRHKQNNQSGKKLLKFMDYNHQFLLNSFKQWEVEFIDNYHLYEAQGLNEKNKGSFFTDQWYPTEHYNAVIRRKIASTLGHFINKECKQEPEVDSKLKQNNYPNWDIIMPLSYDGLTSESWLNR